MRSHSRSPCRRSGSREIQKRKRSSSKESKKRKRSPSHKVKKEPESPRNKDRGSPSNERRKEKKRSSHRERSGERENRSREEFRERQREDAERPNVKTEIDNFPTVKSEDVKTEEVEKEGVNMGLSGALAKETNTFNGIVIKYSEPPEARKPKRRWRFYVFKGDEVLPTLHLHRQSAFLMGRDRKVCDLPIDHPSCSKQHAVFQYRLVSRKRADGMEANRVFPYIIDLGSANGTYLNNQKIEPQRYVELKEKDVLKFGYSSREYVLLHENSEDQD